MRSSKNYAHEPVLGIPVRFDRGFDGISDSRGVGRWREIVVGPSFMFFPPREQQALLLHEAAHHKRGHIAARLKRLWWLIVRPRAFAALCRRQELEADRFAAHCGYGPDLIRAFSRLMPSPPKAGLDAYLYSFHPPVLERIARVTELLPH